MAAPSTMRCPQSAHLLPQSLDAADRRDQSTSQLGKTNQIAGYNRGLPKTTTVPFRGQILIAYGGPRTRARTPKAFQVRVLDAQACSSSGDTTLIAYGVPGTLGNSRLAHRCPRNNPARVTWRALAAILAHIFGLDSRNDSRYTAKC